MRLCKYVIETINIEKSLCKRGKSVNVRVLSGISFEQNSNNDLLIEIN